MLLSDAAAAAADGESCLATMTEPGAFLPHYSSNHVTLNGFFLNIPSLFGDYTPPYLTEPPSSTFSCVYHYYHTLMNSIRHWK